MRCICRHLSILTALYFCTVIGVWKRSPFGCSSRGCSAASHRYSCCQFQPLVFSYCSQTAVITQITNDIHGQYTRIPKPSLRVSGITVTDANAAQLCFRGKDDGSRRPWSYKKKTWKTISFLCFLHILY
jgi:hypothetical protein